MAAMGMINLRDENDNGKDIESYVCLRLHSDAIFNTEVYLEVSQLEF